MKKTTSRRLFLQRSAIATTGVAFLSTGIVQAFTSGSPYDGYNPYSEEKTDLRTTFFEKQLNVKGVLFGKSSMKPLANATIEVWHLSPNSTKYRHRGKLTTNESGVYNFITDIPNRKTAQTSRIYFKVTNNGETVFTEMALDKSGGYITSDHWEKNQHLGEKLFPKSQTQFNTQTINFNLSI